MFRILIVCTANICRSPMGEVILKDLVAANHLRDQIEVSSAGLLGIEGEKASDLAITIAREQGLNLESHRSQGITPQLVNNSDLILCMTSDHKTDLQSLFPSYQEKIHTLKEYLVKDEITKNYIDDPIGLSLNFYRRIFLEIQTEMERIFPELEKAALKK